MKMVMKFILILLGIVLAVAVAFIGGIIMAAKQQKFLNKR
jgi:ABC-type dipeptide/oligopeptide/nickel transport system permease component